MKRLSIMDYLTLLYGTVAGVSWYYGLRDVRNRIDYNNLTGFIYGNAGNMSYRKITHVTNESKSETDILKSVNIPDKKIVAGKSVHTYYNFEKFTTVDKEGKVYDLSMFQYPPDMSDARVHSIKRMTVYGMGTFDSHPSTKYYWTSTSIKNTNGGNVVEKFIDEGEQVAVVTKTKSGRSKITHMGDDNEIRKDLRENVYRISNWKTALTWSVFGGASYLLYDRLTSKKKN
jgi:hypothetical protein